MIFDTSVVLRILKDEHFMGSVKGKVDEEVKISTISAYELLRGAIYMNIAHHSKKELNIILDVVSSMNVVELGREGAKIASYIWARLKEKGVSLNDADILIAATCVQNNDKLLTLDKDFKKIKEVHDKFDVEVIE
ncbi:MAG: type II toxin-antitoxin system VapC family toxin [Archaeoglobaceae archaeon]